MNGSAIPTSSDSVISRILGLPHVPQDFKVDPSLYASDNFPLLEKIALALGPGAIVAIGVRHGFGIVALLHGSHAIRQVTWFDAQTALPDANRLCRENLDAYLRRGTTRRADIRCAFGLDFRALGGMQRPDATVELALIDGSLGHRHMLEALDACRARHCDYVAVNHYNTYTGIRKAVDQWSASNENPALAINSHFGLALFDFSDRQDAAARLQAAGVPLGDRAIPPQGGRNTCWCGGELLEYAHLAYGECARCGTLVRRRPAEQRAAATGVERDLRHAFPYFHSLVQTHRPGASSVLEIGRARGGFPSYCSEQGAGAGVASGFPDAALPQGSFDVIAAFDVLERFPDQVQALAPVADRLARDGIVLIQTPRYTDQGADWAQFALGHRFLHTATSIRDLFRYCGLEVAALHKGTDADRICIVGRRRAARVAEQGGRYRPEIGIGLVEHMGDVVATEPVVRYLRRVHPEARISWVTRAPYADIAAANPGVDEVIAVECLTDWIRMLKHGKFDLAFDLHVNGRTCTTCRIPLRKSGRCSSINFGNIFAGRSVLAGSCKAAGLPELDETPQVHIPASAQAVVDALGLPAKFVAVHCVSNDPARTWPVHHWVRLAELIHDQFRMPVVEIGLSPVLSGVRGVRTDACGLALTDTAELIRRASSMVCMHSGFSHVANGCRVPAVVLSGKYEHYDEIYPFSGAFARENFEYLSNRGQAPKDLPFEQVAEAVRRILARTVALGTAISERRGQA